MRGHSGARSPGAEVFGSDMRLGFLGRVIIDVGRSDFGRSGAVLIVEERLAGEVLAM